MENLINETESTNNEQLYYNETPEEFQARVDALVSKYDLSKFSEEQKKLIRNKAAEKIHQENVNKILLDLVKDIKALPQEEQDAFWGKGKK